MKNTILALALFLGLGVVVAKVKVGSSQVNGTVIAPKAVKVFGGLTLELRLYEYDPFLADFGATLVAKKWIKDFVHQAG